MTRTNQVFNFFSHRKFIIIIVFILGIIEPIKPFYITDRRKTVAIIVIQMFEIFEIVDKTLIDLSDASQSSIWMKIFIRMSFVLVNGQVFSLSSFVRISLIILVFDTIQYLLLYNFKIFVFVL